MDAVTQKKLRAIPSLSEILGNAAVLPLIESSGVEVVKFVLRGILDEYRQAIFSGTESNRESASTPPKIEPQNIVTALAAQLTRLVSPQGRKAINATGILLHTGLGRAPLSSDALAAIAGVGAYAVLQTRLDTGKRAPRGELIEQVLKKLTNCEAATLVNNNAAATMLALHTLALGKEVIISRGQLIEIGGEFRMPDVMSASGAIMREVGTTNRTHLPDYETAINANTGAIIHVHTSNYRVRGFTSTPSLAELTALGRKHCLPVIDDLGSGALVSLAPWGLPDEPLIQESLAAGAEIVCASGDKLIGGPQCGILFGKREAVQRLRKNPFARMFRVCKLTEAALLATLLHFLNGTHPTGIPLYQQLALSVETLNARAITILDKIKNIPKVTVEVVAGETQMGGGTIPDESIPTRLLRLSQQGRAVESLAADLRLVIPATFGRIKDERLLFDLRTVQSEEVPLLTANLRKVLQA